LTDGAALAGAPHYDRSPRLALAEMPADARDAWRVRHAVHGDAELRAQALIERAEAALQAAGRPVTIRTVWMLLADRAGANCDTNLKAAAALAGMAMGLQPA